MNCKIFLFELKRILPKCLIVFVVFNLLAAKPSEPDWGKRMDELRSVLSELLPDVISDQQYNSPKNFGRIEKNTKKLTELTHDMPEEKLSGNKDASIAIISGLFKDQILLAYGHLMNGHRAYARSILKSVPRYCIACHTRSASTLDLSSLQKEVPKVLQTSLEKAEYFDATWQFDKAFEEFQKILTDPQNVKDHELEWQRAVYYAIATSVRVKRDPERAMTIVDLILNSTEAPQFVKREAHQWQISLQQWKDEEPKNLTNGNDLLNEAERLLDLALQLQEYQADHSADILYLRATSCLHDFLSSYPDSHDVVKALLLLGNCYEALQPPELWKVHELYYEACIRKSPHTEIAQTCYERYEQSVFFGYSGSAGLSLPTAVKKHLNELKKLATPS
jgi:hypothetical protein